MRNILIFLILVCVSISAQTSTDTKSQIIAPPTADQRIMEFVDADGACRIEVEYVYRSAKKVKVITDLMLESKDQINLNPIANQVVFKTGDENNLFVVRIKFYYMNASKITMVMQRELAAKSGECKALASKLEKAKKLNDKLVANLASIQGFLQQALAIGNKK